MKYFITQTEESELPDHNVKIIQLLKPEHDPLSIEAVKATRKNNEPHDCDAESPTVVVCR